LAAMNRYTGGSVHKIEFIIAPPEGTDKSSR
jgi:hypothetical protein